MKILCIVVDTATARNDLESASRRYWERMSFDLRAEASSRLVAIVEFLSSSARELDKRPHNVEEIGLVYETYSRIQNASEGTAKELEDVSGLARVLAAWTREKLEGRICIFVSEVISLFWGESTILLLRRTFCIRPHFAASPEKAISLARGQLRGRRAGRR